MTKTKIQEDLEKKLAEIDSWKKGELSRYRNKTKGIAEDRKNQAICEALIETLPPIMKRIVQEIGKDHKILLLETI